MCGGRISGFFWLEKPKKKKKIQFWNAELEYESLDLYIIS